MSHITITRQTALVSLPIFLGLVAGCQSGKASVPAAHAAEHAGPPHWSYAGDTGPGHWGSLSPDYALCAAGRQQSPVDIGQPAPADLSNLVFHYQPVPVEIVNNGHTVQVNYAPGSWMDVSGARYDLAQFHFHSPSEHTIGGKHHDAEMHLVHKSKDGALAVVGVMLEEGSHNAQFDAVWRHLPAEAGAATRFDDKIDATTLLPDDQRTFRYDGSLTTPPGTEGVRWFLMTEPVTLSKDQLTAFKRIHQGNNRPTQPLNGRTLQQDTTR